MPAGGTWTAQNKIRPGAYINFVYRGTNNLTFGDRGTIAVAMDLEWGPYDDVIEVTTEEMITGKSLGKVGLVGDSSEDSLPLRIALAGANRALVYRLNANDSMWAMNNFSGHKLLAKYTGAFGNRITVSNTLGKEDNTLQVFVDGALKETHTYKHTKELEDIDTDYIQFYDLTSSVSFKPKEPVVAEDEMKSFLVFDGHPSEEFDEGAELYIENPDGDEEEGTLIVRYIDGWKCISTYTSLNLAIPSAQLMTKAEEEAGYTYVLKYYKKMKAEAGVTLKGGRNGTEAADLTNFFNLIKYKQFQTIAACAENEDFYTQIINWVKLQREDMGKKIVGVVVDKPETDYEGIISVDQGWKNDTDTVTPSLFAVYVASLSAAAQVNESLTCRAIPEATTIINPIDESDIDRALQSGKFILTYRQDGAVIMEKDINTLHTFTTDKGYSFSKNRVVRVLDEIGNTVALRFNSSYAGKVDNNETGRALFKSEVIGLMNNLQNSNAIQNFEAGDIQVYQGADIDSVIVDLYVQPVDAMEKLYMTVYVTA